MGKSKFFKSPLTQAVSIALLTIGISACGSSSSSGGGSSGGGGVGGGVPDLNLNGGKGSDGVGYAQGGNGGFAYVVNYFGGNTEIRTEGVADAGFTPISIDGLGDTGANPLNVTADTTILAVTLFPVIAEGGAVGMGTNYIHSNGNILRTATGVVAAEGVDVAVVDNSYYAPTAGTFNLFIADGIATVATAGTPYFRGGNSLIYLSSGDLVADAVATGVQVSAGSTLTVALNNSPNASINTNNDFINRGIVTTADASPTQRGNLFINANYYFADGDINTNGAATGQNGGDVNLYTTAMYNRGDVDTSGANSGAGNGGDAGTIDMYGLNGVVNAGGLDLDGGDATGVGVGSGGTASGATLYSLNGSVANAGAVSATGGDGDIGGGDGGGLMATTRNTGSVYNSGDVTAPGGAGSGYGGDIGLSTYGGAVLSSGKLDVSGGDSNVANPDGGEGGRVILYRVTNYSTGTEAGIILSGDIDISGSDSASVGMSATGGNGGSFLVFEGGEGNITDPFIPGAGNRPRIALLGYSNLSFKGGDGGVGGYGGFVGIISSDVFYSSLGQTMPSGNTTIEAAIDARGGDSTVTSGANPDYYGGEGGFVTMYSSYGYMGFPENQLIVNSGDMDMSAGNTYGNNLNLNPGGSIGMYGYSGVTNSGSMKANGSNDSINVGTMAGRGSDGGLIMFQSLAAVDNTGSMAASGGNGEYLAGGGGMIGMYGNGLVNTAALVANGGAADGGITGSIGGNGGCIAVDGSPGSTNHSGSISYTAGTGETNGNEGGSNVGGIFSGNWVGFC